jgi:hypothetical protein
MTDLSRPRLEELTRRWRVRHDARVAERGREPADPEQEARATTSFPWASQTPAEYAARHGSAMIGYTFDDYRYADPRLDAWLVELGRILRDEEGR